MLNKVYDIVQKIRDKIERGQKYYLLMSNKINWNQFCASIYAIEDSQCAIDAYRELPFPTDIKGKYLFTYGLLQAFYLQQDAANGLSNALCNKKIDFKTKYPLLYNIRELRNDTVGHPTKRTQGKGSSETYSFIQISQITMKKIGFYYHLYSQNNDFQPEYIYANLDKAIIEQSECITEILTTVCDFLDKEYYDHLKKFEGNKMVKIFDQLKFAKEKALTDIFLNSLGIQSAEDIFKKCKEALTSRFGDWRYFGGSHLIREIDSIFELIKELEAKQDFSQIRYFLAKLMFKELEELQGLCKEVDEEFENGLKEYSS